MRLTLRTLLAYRDGVLDPKDAAILEAKILESSTAQRISQRISDEMQNRRLAPIPVDAREFGFEANMVAEFLDDTIPMETLPEMERKCLENNILLSEIGSCHQILSRALSIPAPVPASLRQRIHELPRNPAPKLHETNGKKLRVDAGSPLRNQDTDSPSTAAAIHASKSVRKSSVELRKTGIELNDGLGRQVPEYLIGRDHGWIKNLAMAALLLAAFVVVGALAIGPLDRVRILLQKSNTIAISETKGKPNGSEANASGISVSTPPKKTSEISSAEDEADAQPIISESAAPPPAPAAAATDSKDPDVAKSELPVAESKAPPPSVATPTPAVVSDKTPKTITKGRMQWLPDTKASSESIVLKRGTREGETEAYWSRMSPGEFVNLGERIVVPPTQRTELRVEPGIRLLCAGDNDLEIQKQTDAPKFTLFSGRLLIFATPDANEISIDCNGLELAISFASSDGSCALELQNNWATLSEEMIANGKIDSRPEVRLIGVEGSLKFAAKPKDGIASKGTLTVGQFVDWKEGVATPTVKELAEAPWWFRTSIARAIDQKAASDLQQAISGRTAGQLETELAELSGLRREETAALAIRTNIMLGRYDGLFDEEGILNRKRSHSHWQSILSQIPQSLSRAENRDALINRIQSIAPNRFQTILTLLVPPSKEQLLAGSDKLLVEGLSSPHLDERVLAIHSLSYITGKTLGYQADKMQLDVVTQWRKLLGKNEIRYNEKSTP